MAWIRTTCLGFLLVMPSLAQTPVAFAVGAKLLRVITGTEGAAAKVACTHGEMGMELRRIGVQVDPASEFAFAASEADLKTYLREGKLVVSNSLDLLRGGAVLAMVMEGGKPALYIATQATRDQQRLPPAIVKAAKRL
jgi:hypothetical protein